MTKPTDVPSSTSNAATPTFSTLPIRPSTTRTAATTANASSSSTKRPRPLPGTPNSGVSGPMPLPTPPRRGSQNSNNPGSRAQSAQTNQPHTSAGEGNLRVFRDPKVLTQFDPCPLVKDYQQLPPSHPLFLAASYCIDTALRVLEHPRGRHGLKEGGKRYVKLMRGKGSAAAFKGDPDNEKEMGEWVNSFLTCVRDDFPNVFVTATLVWNAVLVRLNRPVNAEKEFKPKHAGIMCLDKWIFDSMLYQAKIIATTTDPMMKEAAERNFRCAIFHMAVIILHEVMHLFIWYTAGDTRPSTPPEMALFPSDERENGESGEWVEHQVFAGYLKFREDPKDPLKKKQTGFPFSITGQGQAVRLVDLQFITTVINPKAKPDFTKIFTPETTSRPFHLEEIRRRYRSMASIKEEEDRQTYQALRKHAPVEAKFQPIILSGDIEALDRKPATELKRNTAPLDPKDLVKAGN